MEKLFNAREAQEWMTEHHPHVHAYAQPSGLFYAMYRKHLKDKGARGVSLKQLERFAQVYQAHPSNSGPKAQIVITSKPNPAPRKKGKKKNKWADLDEMIASTSARDALVIPRGVRSLEEIE